MTRFEGAVRPADLTVEQARLIRSWRVDEDYPYRSVAQAATDLWGSGWGSNQAFGEELCRGAATLLGENLNDEAWS